MNHEKMVDERSVDQKYDKALCSCQQMLSSIENISKLNIHQKLTNPVTEIDGFALKTLWQKTPEITTDIYHKVITLDTSRPRKT